MTPLLVAIPVTAVPLEYKLKFLLSPVNSVDISSKTTFFAYVSSLESWIPERINVLPWKLDEVDIPVQSLSSGGLVVVPSGKLP